MLFFIFGPILLGGSILISLWIFALIKDAWDNLND